MMNCAEVPASPTGTTNCPDVVGAVSTIAPGLEAD